MSKIFRDLHNNIKIIRSLSPKAVTTDGGETGVGVDRKGYQAVELAFAYGSITTTTGVVTATVEHSDAETTGFATVTAALLLGSGFGLTSAATRTSGVSKNVTKRVGYRGYKRYVRGKVVPTGTAAAPMAIDVILGAPDIAATD